MDYEELKSFYTAKEIMSKLTVYRIRENVCHDDTI